MFGQHLLKSWSSTQPSISLSSGEAEYYGVVKATGIAIGQQSLMSDLGMDIQVRAWTDSSAAIGICGRSGLGKLRHVQTHTLWVQERVRTGAIELRKVHGEVNPADLFTKHLASKDRIEQLVRLFNCEYRDGRADSAPRLRRQQTTAHGETAAAAHVAAGVLTASFVGKELCGNSVFLQVGQMEESHDAVMHDPSVLPAPRVRPRGVEQHVSSCPCSADRR